MRDNKYFSGKIDKVSMWKKLPTFHHIFQFKTIRLLCPFIFTIVKLKKRPPIILGTEIYLEFLTIVLIPYRLSDGLRTLNT